jgi:anti-sigma factor RsiW
MTCTDVQNLVTDYFEDSLSQTERAAIDAHLQTCTACRTYFAEYTEAVRQVRRLKLAEVPTLKREFLFQNVRKNLPSTRPARVSPAQRRLVWIILAGALILFSFWNYKWRRGPATAFPNFSSPRTAEFLLEEHDMSQSLSPLQPQSCLAVMLTEFPSR